jgi:hypothetical protein
MRSAIGGQPPEAPPTAVTPPDYKNSSGSDLEEMDRFRRCAGLPSILIMGRGYLSDMAPHRCATLATLLLQEIG